MSNVMSIQDFCREMQISTATFYRQKKAKDVPPTFMYGRYVRMLRIDFATWLVWRASGAAERPRYVALDQGEGKS